jgi:hypothetical protein
MEQEIISRTVEFRCQHCNAINTQNLLILDSSHKHRNHPHSPWPEWEWMDGADTDCSNSGAGHWQHRETPYAYVGNNAAFALRVGEDGAVLPLFERDAGGGMHLADGSIVVPESGCYFYIYDLTFSAAAGAASLNLYANGMHKKELHNGLAAASYKGTGIVGLDAGDEVNLALEAEDPDAASDPTALGIQSEFTLFKVSAGPCPL